jgi:hypothetical protein
MAAKKLAARQRLVFHGKFAGDRQHQERTANRWPSKHRWVSEPIISTTRESPNRFSNFREYRGITEAAGIPVAQ